MSTSDVNGVAQVLALLRQHPPAAVSGSSNFLSLVWDGMGSSSSSLVSSTDWDFLMSNVQFPLQQQLSHIMPRPSSNNALCLPCLPRDIFSFRFPIFYQALMEFRTC